MNKRAKPTALTLAERAYRKTLALEKAVIADARENRQAIRRDLSAMYGELHKNDCLTHSRLEALTNLVQILTDSHTGVYATLVDHCVRLLREKETLQKQVEAHDAAKKEEAARTIAISDFAPEKRSCMLEHLHRDGIICAVCNYNAPQRFEYRGPENESITVHSHPYGLPCTDECKSLKATPK